ncbi:hypothetical protein ACUH94_00825 [Dermabacteraceae bacterium P7074]
MALTKDKCFPGEDWVSLKLDSIQIMPMNTWTNVNSFWQEILDATEKYITTEAGKGAFSEEATTFSIERKGTIAIFELRGKDIQ